MGVIPEKFAIMTVDPGGTTGVAQGLFKVVGEPTTSKLMRRAVRKKVVRVDQVVPASAYRETVAASTSMAIQVYRAWNKFQFKALVELGIPMPYIFLVFERFQLRQRDTELSPVEVTHATLALLAAGEIDPNGMTWPSIRWDQQLRFQEPSTAMTYATGERLRLWGLWDLTKGKDHARDATKHLALAASTVMNGDWNDLVVS